MLDAILSDILFPDGPFFGGNTSGIQGDPVRHVFMSAALAQAAPADRPMRLLEVGSWIGSSALTWAQAMDMFAPHKGSITCVDPWIPYFTKADQEKGEVYRSMDAMARSDLAYALFRHNIRFARPSVRIDDRRGMSSDVLPTLESAAYDLVYIDANHYADEVMEDLRLASRLVREGGILCGDDLELRLEECDAAFAEANPRSDTAIDPRTGRQFHPGVTLAVARFFGSAPSYAGFWAMRRQGDGFVPVHFTEVRALIPEHFPEPMKQAIRNVLKPVQGPAA